MGDRSTASEFRALFAAIARATLASSALAGCADEVHFPAGDGAAPSGGGALQDGGALRDGGALYDGGVLDDGGAPRDASALDDRGARDAATLPDGGPMFHGELVYATLPCTTGVPVLAAPTTTPPADGVAIYRRADLYGLPQATPPFYAEHIHGGVAPCADSDSPCQVAVNALVSAPPCNVYSDTACRDVAVTTASGAHTRLLERSELLALFGPIDSVAEAVLLAAFDGYVIGCPHLAGDGKLQLAGTGTFVDADGVHILSEWEECSAGAFRERYLVAADGTIRNEAERATIGGVTCVIGRLPPGVCGPHRAPARETTAGFLAEVAELEAAAVLAFRQIEAELLAHGAPAELVARARAALYDEVRHADVMARAARCRGATPVVPRTSPTQLRSLFALACDNAHEGCVRETFGALVATYQGETARDGALRLALRQIAEDETRHAALSWDIAAWIAPQLDAAEQAELRRVRERALAGLAGELDLGLDPEAYAELGMPRPEVAAQLLAELRASLYA